MNILITGANGQVGWELARATSVLGNVVAAVARPPWPRCWLVALLVLACSAVFDLLFLVVGTLPATVPVAVALGLIEVERRRRGSRRR